MIYRYWLLSTTFYGNWLPGDPRGFVSSVRDQRPTDSPSNFRHEHDMPGTPYDADFAGLHHASKELLKQPPIRIQREQAEVLAKQFHETSQYRGWHLPAFAIMDNHVHWVVGVIGDPNPEKILGDFKAYGSRALSRTWGQPVAGTWWTSKGSKRKLDNQTAVHAAVEYVRRQRAVLILYVKDNTAE
jgi:REP element-mobilizing transposase RayT